ncbi:MAG: AMP-binding protein [Planctomycetes bacterium]|nr:AMP-binding protein [Planctomycetota bacterium]
MNVFDFLADAARSSPRAIAWRGASPGAGADYASAHGAALQLARRLVERGVLPGDRVACLMHNCVEHWLAYYAVAAAGAIFVSLNTRLATVELQAIVAHSGACLVLHDGPHTGAAAALGPAPLAVFHRELGGEPLEPELADGHSPAQLYYTSGTTGRPKGVVLTHDNVVTHARTAADELSLRGTDRWAHIAPMFHLADAWAAFAITHVCGEHSFLPQFSAIAALDLLEHERTTITNLVPTMLNLMVADASAEHRGYGLRLMLSGGAPIAPEVVRRVLQVFRCDYVQTYGMTETSPYLTLGILPPELAALPAEERLRMQCKTGRPFRGVELRVVDDAGHPVPADGSSVGEIRVRGATVTPGYWQDPQATAAAFDAEGFLCTGDLATIDAHGFVDIVDRKKDVIKTGGENVYSVEVEHVLYTHPAVLECAVIGAPHPVWGEMVTAAVVLRPGAVTGAEELIAHVRDRLAHFKAPKKVFFLDALPRTGSGKITKRALRDQLG